MFRDDWWVYRYNDCVYIQMNIFSWVWWHVCSPRTRLRRRQEEQELKVKVGSVANSRPTWDEWDLDSKTKFQDGGKGWKENSQTPPTTPLPPKSPNKNNETSLGWVRYTGKSQNRDMFFQISLNPLGMSFGHIWKIPASIADAWMTRVL